MRKKSKYYILGISLFLILFSTILFNKPELMNSKKENKNCYITYSYMPMEFETLMDKSDVILKGTVKNVSSSYKANAACIIDETGYNIENNKEKAEEAYANGADMVFIVRDNDAANKVINEYETGRGLVFTDKTIEVSQYYKNNLGLDEVIVREDGGEINNKFVKVAGQTSLCDGDEVILFLEKLNSNKYSILGGAQGKYYVYGNNAVNDEMGKKNSMDLSELVAKLL